MNEDLLIGKYRAIVVNNNDPKNMGRITVMCPSALGDYESTWCIPCIPTLGDNIGIMRIPKVGEAVWVEFEGGSPNYPIWTGGWSVPNSCPNTLDNQYVIKIGQSTLTIKETGELSYNVNSRQVLKIDNNGIVIKGNLKVEGTITN